MPLNPFLNNPDEFITLDILSRAYGTRPSEIAGIGKIGSWAAYQFDLCTFLYAHHAREKTKGENEDFSDPSVLRSLG